jgi:hypothetical protein
MAIPLARSLTGQWAATMGVEELCWDWSCHCRTTKMGLLRTEDACRYKDGWRERERGDRMGSLDQHSAEEHYCANCQPRTGA